MSRFREKYLKNMVFHLTKSLTKLIVKGTLDPNFCEFLYPEMSL